MNNDWWDDTDFNEWIIYEWSWWSWLLMVCCRRLSVDNLIESVHSHNHKHNVKGLTHLTFGCDCEALTSLHWGEWFTHPLVIPITALTNQMMTKRRAVAAAEHLTYTISPTTYCINMIQFIRCSLSFPITAGGAGVQNGEFPSTGIGRVRSETVINCLNLLFN